eukprot:m.144645 g.144645  ORF g.144645 m.144645 type:complete len:601 (+) comp30386_c0_seq2:233-2035(+)
MIMAQLLPMCMYMYIVLTVQFTILTLDVTTAETSIDITDTNHNSDLDDASINEFDSAHFNLSSWSTLALQHAINIFEAEKDRRRTATTSTSMANTTVISTSQTPRVAMRPNLKQEGRDLVISRTDNHAFRGFVCPAPQKTILSFRHCSESHPRFHAGFGNKLSSSMYDGDGCLGSKNSKACPEQCNLMQGPNSKSMYCAASDQSDFDVWLSTVTSNADKQDQLRQNKQQRPCEVVRMDTDNTESSISPSSGASVATKTSGLVCAQPEMNKVALRGDGHGVDQVVVRPWTITTASFPLAVVGSSDSPEVQQCATMAEVLFAVENGKRRWVDEVYHGNDTCQSIFEPAKCNLPDYSKALACGVISRYERIIMIGDSHTRHHYQGLLMTMAQDFAFGACMTSSKLCICDGQFSESKKCRSVKYDIYGQSCPHLCGDFGRSFVEYISWTSRAIDEDGNAVVSTADYDWSHLCSDDLRPRFVWLQGGLHYGLNSMSAFEKVLTPTVETIRRVQHECDHNVDVHIVWSGVGTQSRVLDEKYHNQRRENAFIFNKEMAEYAAAMQVPSVNFLNLTADAQTSDGNHYLSDVNVAKAHVLLSVADMMLS